MRDALRYFRSWNATVQIQHLGSDLLHDIRGGLNAHQLVPKYVSRSHYFDFADVVAVESGAGDSEPVHLSSEDFVAEEPVSKDAAVAIRTVQALSASHIGEFSQERVHSVVLFLRIVQMTTVLVDLVAANHPLQQKERIEILVFPAWSIVKNTDGRVGHLVVADH